MVYRNVYFVGNAIRTGSGKVDLLYYGQIFSNAKNIKNFSSKFDKSLDILIECGDCAKKKYKNLIKVSK